MRWFFLLAELRWIYVWVPPRGVRGVASSRGRPAKPRGNSIVVRAEALIKENENADNGAPLTTRNGAAQSASAALVETKLAAYLASFTVAGGILTLPKKQLDAARACLHNALSHRVRCAEAENRVHAQAALDAAAALARDGEAEALVAPDPDALGSFNVYSLAQHEFDNPTFRLPRTPVTVSGGFSAYDDAIHLLKRKYTSKTLHFKRLYHGVFKAELKCRRGQVRLQFEVPGPPGDVDIAAAAAAAQREVHALGLESGLADFRNRGPMCATVRAFVDAAAGLFFVVVRDLNEESPIPERSTKLRSLRICKQDGIPAGWVRRGAYVMRDPHVFYRAFMRRTRAWRALRDERGGKSLGGAAAAFMDRKKSAVFDELEFTPGLKFPSRKARARSLDLLVDVSAFYGSTSAEGACLSNNTAFCEAVLAKTGVALEPGNAGGGRRTCVRFRIEFWHESVAKSVEDARRLTSFLAATVKPLPGGGVGVS
jgi:hypothetical protein